MSVLLRRNEFRRTQGGNDNAHCQNDETGWHDWSVLDRNQGVHRFASGIMAFRMAHPVLSEERCCTNTQIHWPGPRGAVPDWSDAKATQLAWLTDAGDRRGLVLLCNAGVAAAEFTLPPAPPQLKWYAAADTSLESPQDLFAAGAGPPCEDPRLCRLGARSSAVLLAR